MQITTGTSNGLFKEKHGILTRIQMWNTLPREHEKCSDSLSQFKK